MSTTPTMYLLNKNTAFQLAKHLIEKNDVEGFNSQFMLMTPQMLEVMKSEALQQERDENRTILEAMKTTGYDENTIDEIIYRCDLEKSLDQPKKE